MSTADVVVVGSFNHDIVLSVANLPAPGETCLSSGRLDSPGGKGSNQAIQAARCGARVAILAAIGADAAGEAALEVWAADGVDAALAPRLPGHATGMAVILVDARGENSIVVDSGANAHLAPSHIAGAAPLIASARLVLAQLETPADATRRAFEIARAAGATTALNAAPATAAIDADLLALTDILFVNEVEAQAMTEEADPVAAATRLLARVGEAVVVTLGAQGALLLRRDKASLRQAAHPVAVVDTTGAGDAFIGAFAARYAKTGDLSAAMAWGAAAGALACAGMGAVASYADAARIEAMQSPPGVARPK